MSIGLYYFCLRKCIQCHCIYQLLSIVLCTLSVMAASHGVGVGSGCLTVGLWDFRVCLRACADGLWTLHA